MSQSQMAMQDREEQKIAQMKQMIQKKPVEKASPQQEPLAQIQRPQMMGLPSIGQRAGNFDIDRDYLKKANAELDRLGFDDKEPVSVDTRTLQEVMREKTSQNEKIIEEKKVESVEQRKARLLAQRDLLREAKKKQMAEELTEFNEKTKTQDNLYEELRKMDANKKKQSDVDELEHRRQIMKGVKVALQEPAKEKTPRKDQDKDSFLDDVQAFKVQ